MLQEQSPWSSYLPLLPPCESYEVTDAKCPQFTEIVENNTDRDTITIQLKALFETLCQYWDQGYSRYIATQIHDHQGNALRDVEPSFAIKLKTSPWVPAVVMKPVTKSRGDGKEKIDLIPDVTLLKPDSVFLHCPKIAQLLAHHVPYLVPECSRNSTFPDFLGVKRDVSLDFVKSLLIGWSKRDSETPDVPAEFHTHMSHVRSVYAYLQENLPPKDLQDLVYQHPVIFTVPKIGDDPEELLMGQFLKRDEVRWSDPSGLFSKYRDTLQNLDHHKLWKPTISHLYSDIVEFFERGARIQEQPDMIEYGRLLIHIASTAHMSRGLPDALKIFTILGQMILKDEKNPSGADTLAAMNVQKLREILKREPCLPIQTGQWKSVDSQPLIADDKQKMKMFQKKEGLLFVDCGEKLIGGERRKRQGNVTLQWSCTIVTTWVKFVSDVSIQIMHKIIKLLLKDTRDACRYVLCNSVTFNNLRKFMKLNLNESVTGRNNGLLLKLVTYSHLYQNNMTEIKVISPFPT